MADPEGVAEAPPGDLPDRRLRDGFHARRVSLATATSVRRALDALVADELVVRRDGVYRVANPFFVAWLRQAG